MDWQVRESVRAKLRNLVRRTLRKWKYPPDKQEQAVELVLKQAEVLCAGGRREWCGAVFKKTFTQPAFFGWISLDLGSLLTVGPLANSLKLCVKVLFWR